MGQPMLPGDGLPSLYKDSLKYPIAGNVFSSRTAPAVPGRREGNHLPELVRFQFWGAAKHMLKIPCLLG